jgi:glycosyltransferase involved in cell wall biosynthesis
VRLLIVSYAFPPVGGVGVQRVTKLAKYLPEFGVAPTILTAENPSVPVTDETLLRDVPASVEVLRTPTLEPGYRAKAAVWRGVAQAGRGSAARASLARLARGIFVPDPQILWLPTAAPAFRRLAGRADAVLVSGPPFSPFLLGLLSNTPFVLDYRDEWRTTAAYEMHGGSLATLVIDAIEPVLLRRAGAVLTATAEFRENLLARHADLDPEKVVVLTNGYDPDDFAAAKAAPPPPAYSPGQKLVVTYAGTSFRLTSPKGLFAGLRLLRERAPAIAEGLDVRFIGRVVETEKRIFDDEAPPLVHSSGHRPHEEALAAVAQSHLALCILDDVPGVESIYPAKIFELMHLGRPCLTVAPPGALSRLVERHGLGVVVHPRSPAAIADTLERAVLAFRRGERVLPCEPVGIEQYHRRALAGRVADVVRGVVH